MDQTSIHLTPHSSSLLSYLSDTSTNEWKTLKFVLTECAMMVGYPIGLLASGQELVHFGYTWVFVTSMSLGALCVMYSLVWLRNDTHKQGEDGKSILADTDDDNTQKEAETVENECSKLLRYVTVSYSSTQYRDRLKNGR